MPRILIIEDEFQLQEMLLEILEENGYEVHGVASGEEAIEWMQKRPFDVDLVLTDVRMPGRDGLDTVAELQRLQEGLKCVVMTGYASADAPVKAMKLAYDYLYKPFDTNTLVKTVARACGQSEPSDLNAMAAETAKEVDQRMQQMVASFPTTASPIALRDQAFRSFYVGVRSRHLNFDEAFHFWNVLEELERDLHGLSQSRNLQQVVDGYHYVIEAVTSFAHKGGTLYFDGSAGPQFAKREEFAGLYQRLSEGHIDGHEQLTLAPLLRTASQTTLQSTPRYRLLREALWGGG